MTIDYMAIDTQENTLILGGANHTNVIPDIDYEISLYLANRGMEDVLDEACNDQ